MVTIWLTFVAENSLLVPIIGTMMNPTWRLSEYTPDNLGLAFTDEGLLLGRTPLIERRGGRFVVREPSDIARLVKYSFPGGVAVDRLMPGLARIASALNANDQAAARIAAVHLHIPDLPGSAARNAMVAEDALIKYARDQGGDSDWNPALQPRAGVPPNPGWFASTDGSQHEPKQDESSAGQSRLRFAENEDRSRRADAAPAVGDHETLQPGNPIDEPANFTDRPDWNHFWSDTWPAIKDWLEEPSRAVGWWENGRAGEPLRLTSESQPRPRRSSASRPLRRPSQHGLVCMLQKQLLSRMLHVVPRQKCGY